ncbi:hypothetical protein [Facklamia sp. P12955]|uniref:hypothetical protein n=1 Tax=unclassified Facklamia TaxID=2622293 RepID=UPI003D186416
MSEQTITIKDVAVSNVIEDLTRQIAILKVNNEVLRLNLENYQNKEAEELNEAATKNKKEVK